MEKKLLIDSLYINESGGLRLLEYLVEQLGKRDISFHLVADARCKGLFDKLPSVEYKTATLSNKVELFGRDLSEFTSVLCFGNIPPTKKISIPVYTYFHNINLLTLNGLPSTLNKIKGWMKREVFRYYKNNTDYWLVQTDNTRDELVKHLGEKKERVLLMPFFNIPCQLVDYSKKKHGEDYVYISTYTGSKQHEELLEAWGLLHYKGIDRTLHLTIPETAAGFLKKLQMAKEIGVRIENHGFIPFHDVVELYGLAKAIVYPSINESLGLGLVEAITAGCDIIGADMPYTYSVCKPSKVFNPFSPTSIADAVIEYEKGESDKSELKIHNMIGEMIELLTTEAKPTVGGAILVFKVRDTRCYEKRVLRISLNERRVAA